mmetsp:Transcript_11753/g.35355  ORF Transcript_11753/g.35355 Transcript_11753/m.35355 type:complete len:119 (-) Transcript_11753:129-485(-)
MLYSTANEVCVIKSEPRRRKSTMGRMMDAIRGTRHQKTRFSQVLQRKSKIDMVERTLKMSEDDFELREVDSIAHGHKGRRRKKRFFRRRPKIELSRRETKPPEGVQQVGLLSRDVSAR